mgnify:CR=1 FL=1
MSYQHKPLNFDRLLDAAQTKPQLLERYLRFKVYQIIARAKGDEKLRLRQLQFRIDSVRYRAKTPLAACIQISEMMHDKLYSLKQVLDHTADIVSKSHSTLINTSLDTKSRSRGKVIQLPFKGKFKA